MDSTVLPQIALMLLETLLVSSILLLFFRLRDTFGLAPIYTMLGVFFQIANLWSATIYVRITPELLLSPGSVVLFPASIFAILFIYIREDAAEARKLIYALLATDFVGSLLNLTAVLHLKDSHVFNPFHLMPALFMHLPRIDFIGCATLYADAIFIILIYEYFARRFHRSLFLPIFLSITLVLWFDTVAFTTGSFWELPNFLSILLSGLAGKTVAGLLYSIVLSIYLARFDAVRSIEDAGHSRELGDLFEVLTYRQRYEAMKIQATKDALTNVYNRAFFNDVLESELEVSRRSGRPLSLLMVDVDHFKQINDKFGHAVGDQALTMVAKALQSTVRQSDFLCRYGGEEFTVILPGTDLEAAIGLAQRVCAEVPNTVRIKSQEITLQDDNEPEERQITITIGLSSYPQETGTKDEMVKLADTRLYLGKQAGRNRVVPEDMSKAVNPLSVK